MAEYSMVRYFTYTFLFFFDMNEIFPKLLKRLKIKVILMFLLAKKLNTDDLAN